MENRPGGRRRTMLRLLLRNIISPTAMTLWELKQRISGDDYRIEGSDPEVNQLCS
jgi:hypothetical protein